jgi:hypothetical protein
LPGGRIARVLFCIESDCMVLLHGFMKKTPQRELDLAPRRAEREGRMKRKNIGATFDSFLCEEGMYEDASAAAIKRVVARQLETTMKEKHITKAEMARRMCTSRSAGCSIPKTRQLASAHSRRPPPWSAVSFDWSWCEIHCYEK